jgi:hypothetical protein
MILMIAIIATLGMARNKNDKVSTAPGTLNKPTVPSTFNSTTANLWVKLSNFGFIGDDAFNNPSFEYPGGSGNHYLYQGSYWIAGKDPVGVVHCTTPDEEETTLSTDPADKLYLYSDADKGTRFDNRPNVDASFAGSQVSDEDTWASHTDLDPGRHNPGEAPLGIRVIERTYKWTAGYNDDFIIWDYQFINIGLDTDGDYQTGETPQTLTDVYIAMRFDADVSFLGGGEYWYDDLTAYYAPKQISYLYDGDDPDVAGNDVGEYGASTGYIYARLLKGAGGTPYTAYTDPVSHAWWTIDDDPSGDELKFVYMSTPGYAGVPASPYDYRFLQTTGPFTMAPGDTINMVWAMGVSEGLDNVILDSDWAKRIFDAGFLAASAPTAPVLQPIAKEDGQVTLRWDASSEQSVDPLTGEQDFEGYRVYKSRRLDDAGNQVWVKIADFDKVNTIGANTGLQYQFVDRDIINGYGYNYAITAYDRGAPSEGLGILESSIRSSTASAFVIASGEVRETADEVYVYPNPFVGSANWDHEFTQLEPFRRRLAFANLPGKCTIKIFTLSGDLVDTIENPEGESLAIWDMISRSEQSIVSGIYLYTVESDKGDHIGKFVVIQ